MRWRARYLHHIEALVDNVIGILINYFMTWLILAVVLGLPVTWSDNAVLSVVLFFISYIRKYTIRRWFSNWINKIYLAQKNEV